MGLCDSKNPLAPTTDTERCPVRLSTPHVEHDPVLEAAGAYAVETWQWQPHEFRLEKKGTTPDGQVTIIWCIPLEEERQPAPGGGRSRVLHVDDQTGKVVKELPFQ
jgi:hypothetical protein